MINVGYACINTTLQKQYKIMCSRGMIKRTFALKGIPYASELALQNCKDLIEVIKWNNKQQISLFRMTSNLFPWASEYNLSDLPHYKDIKIALRIAGREAKKHNQRLSFHPGQFNVLSSPHQHVIANTIKELTTHGEIMDLMELPQTHFSKINIHIGGTYGDHVSAAKTWCNNFRKLPECVRNRLTVENDDKKSQFSTKDLHDYIYSDVGVPIVFDSHHYAVGAQGGQTEEEALRLAAATWNDIKPCCHMSSSAILEGKDKKPQAHSDYILSKFNDYGLDLDVMLEAKAKELALLKYRKEHETS